MFSILLKGFFGICCFLVVVVESTTKDAAPASPTGVGVHI